MLQPLHLQALEIAARITESHTSLQRDVRISHSVIPEHLTPRPPCKTHLYLGALQCLFLS
jgi:hypothetical protein